MTDDLFPPDDAGEVGMQLALERAERDHPGWSDAAVLLAEQHARNVAPKAFLIEEVRAYAYSKGLPVPPNERAWGPIPRILAKLGVIEAVGTRNARSSHLSPKVTWRAVEAPTSTP